MLTDKDKIITEELKKILPANRISQPQNSKITIKTGVNINKSHNFVLISGNHIILLIIILLCTLYAINIRSGKIITTAQFDHLQATIQYISKCTNTPIKSIYTGLKKEHNVYNLRRIPVRIYEKIIKNYSKIKCKE